MKLDRNINSDGKGKYALVRLRGIEKESAGYYYLQALDALGHLDWGCVGQPDEFFVVKLRDKYADRAISAYAEAVMDDARHSLDDDRSRDLAQYAIQVKSIEGRAGILSEFCKEPD